MPYATLQQLIDRYGERLIVELTDRGEMATGEIDVPTVDRALTDADAMIDGYLAGRYQLPLSTTPALVSELAAKIAVWNLHTSQPEAKIEADYKSAERMLGQISTGAIQLQVAGVAPSGTGGSGARITDRERPLTERNMKGFI